MENEKLKKENENNEKPFNFWKFMGLMFIGLIILASIVLGLPYLIEQMR